MQIGPAVRARREPGRLGPLARAEERELRQRRGLECAARRQAVLAQGEIADVHRASLDLESAAGGDGDSLQGEEALSLLPRATVIKEVRDDLGLTLC